MSTYANFNGSSDTDKSFQAFDIEIISIRIKRFVEALEGL